MKTFAILAVVGSAIASGYGSNPALSSPYGEVSSVSPAGPTTAAPSATESAPAYGGVPSVPVPGSAVSSSAPASSAPTYGDVSSVQVPSSAVASAPAPSAPGYGGSPSVPISAPAGTTTGNSPISSSAVPSGTAPDYGGAIPSGSAPASSFITFSAPYPTVVPSVPGGVVPSGTGAAPCSSGLPGSNGTVPSYGSGTGVSPPAVTAGAARLSPFKFF